jgi:integrase
MAKIPASPDEIQARIAELDAERKELLKAVKAAEPEAKAPTRTLPRRRLTDLSIKHIKAPETGRIQVPDTVIGGLWLRISDTGARSWSVVYRTPGRSTPQRVTLGKFPGLTCAGARAAAKAVLASVAGGKDPAAEKREKRHQNGDLVEQVAAEFVARQYRKRGLKSTKEIEAMFANHVLPRLTRKRIGQVSQHELMMVVDAVSDAGFPRAANKVVQLLKQLFKWSKGRGLITDEDPAVGLEKPHVERSRDRVLSDAELAAVWRASEQLDWPWHEYVKLLVLLGQRRTEVASMKRDDIDLEARVWHLPAEQTKMGRARTLPLPGAVVEVLEEMPRFEGSDYVFGRKLTGFDRMKKELDTISGVTGWVLHDLRRTFATGQQRLGTRLEVTEQALGHLAGSRSGVVGVYQRFDFMAEQRIALEKWAEHVQRLVGGGGAKVVQLPAREG